jgi:cobalt-zinc-cadmium resistance protein CzcA
MLEWIVSASIRRRALVVAAAALAVVFLARSAFELSIDAVPDITNVQVTVFTRTAPMGAADVERYVTYPVELALQGIPKVTELRSVSRFGISAVTVVFEDGTDLYWARQLVTERLREAGEHIPAGFGEPQLLAPSTGLGEVYQFSLRSPDGSVSAMALREKLDWEIAPRLRALPGVVEVAAEGGELRQFQVVLDPRRLVSYGLGVADVLDALEKNNAVAGGGYVEHAGEAYLISANGLVSTLEELRTVVVSTRGGVPITVGHLGEVRYGAAPRVGAGTANGVETVNGVVLMLVGENARLVTARVGDEIAGIRAGLPRGILLETFYDRGLLVDRVLTTVAKNLAEGGALVVLILLALLGSLRAGLVVAAVIPVAMTVAAAAMRRAGITGNLMSLGALDFGLIVDGTVVMVEHMVTRVSQAADQGLDRDAALLGAAREVARPVAFGVAIICIVYLPILTLEGVEGRMFHPMAYTVLFALVASLAFALTVAPALTSLAFRRGGRARETPFFLLALRGYRRVLGTALARPVPVLAGAAAVVAAGLLLALTLGSEFVPRLDEGDLTVQIVRLPSVSLEESVRSTRAAEDVIRRFPEVDHVASRTGTSEGSTDVMGMEDTDVFVILKPYDEWPHGRTKADLVADLEVALTRALPGAALAFTQPIEERFNEMLAGVRADVAVKVFGEDLDLLRETALRVARALKRVPGAADVRVESPVDGNAVSVAVDRDRIARYGVAAADVLAAVEAAGSGRVVGAVLEGKRRFDLVVRLDPRLGLPPTAGTDLRWLGHVPVATRGGALLPVDELAHVAITFGPAQIDHEDASRRLAVECNVRGRDLGGFIAAARTAVDAVSLPEGYWLKWGGQFENLERARARLLVVVPVALALIFLMLFVAYGRALDAARVFTGVPFAAVGGIAALWARGLPFSISAGVGFVVLSGVSVLGDIVMVSSIRQRLDRGEALRAAIVGAAEGRLRPVLMTALVASLGFLPMALNTGIGSEVQRPLATVVIGGVVSSTALTLLVLPVLFAALRGKAAAPAAPAAPGAAVVPTPGSGPQTPS